MKIYIAGPMTGLPEYNYPAFRSAAVLLRGEGHEVVNPVELGEKYGTADEINTDPVKFADLILEELDALKECDVIYLLHGWQTSKGTRKELKLALENGLDVLVEDDGYCEVCDILDEMMERDDLNGRDMVDNFHIEYGERGGWDGLELLKAYAARIRGALKRGGGVK